MSDNDATTRRKATEYGGWVGDTILRLMEERDAARDLLRKYGWHIPGCAALNGAVACDCGYTAAFIALHQEQEGER